MTMKVSEPNAMVIIVDTRETTPFEFPGRKVIRKALKVGDYSLLGFEDKIAIERKTVSDFLSSITTNREQFMKRLSELSKLQRKFLIIESTLQYLWSGNYGFAKVNANSVIGTICKIAVEFNIQPIFSNGHRLGSIICDRILEQFYKKFREGKLTIDTEPLMAKG